MTAPTLAEMVAQYGGDAYLLSIANDGPHMSFVSVSLDGSILRCALGKSAAKNIAGVPEVSLFWPPMEAGGYALIVNGKALPQHGQSSTPIAAIAPTKGVLHRAGAKPPGGDGPCASDCRRVTLPKSTHPG